MQFYWDREGKRDQNSSCWLRVAQAWAGNQWGSFVLPRIGQEVLVTFLDGDPDRPLVTGSVYNAATQPPYDLPANKTRTAFKSQSTPGGGGFNELRIDDKKGSEQLFAHAEKDANVFVKNDWRQSVDHDTHLIVQKDAFDSIGQDLHLTVAAQRNIKVGKTLSEKIGADAQIKAGSHFLQQAGRELHMKGGQSLVLDAGMSITLKAGGGTIVLNPSGVSISGRKVRINSGGSGRSAKAASPVAPGNPAKVDPGKVGNAIRLNRSNSLNSIEKIPFATGAEGNGKRAKAAPGKNAVGTAPAALPATARMVANARPSPVPPAPPAAAQPIKVGEVAGKAANAATFERPFLARMLGWAAQAGPFAAIAAWMTTSDKMERHIFLDQRAEQWRNGAGIPPEFSTDYNGERRALNAGWHYQEVEGKFILPAPDGSRYTTLNDYLYAAADGDITLSSAYDPFNGNEVLRASYNDYQANGGQMSESQYMAEAGGLLGLGGGSGKTICPNSLEDAENILKNRRRQIAAEGYKPKYTDAELAQLAQQGDIGSERFQVRFMEQRYLNDRLTPDEPLSGTMGMVMKGETGEGAKYWSTSLDQIEDADSDPKLISEKLGLEYDPTKKYALVVVDTEKSIPLTGVKSVPATFEKVSEFANTELPDDFPKDFTDKAMTPEFQAEYAKHYNAAVESGDLPNPWSRDTGAFKKYLQTTDLPLEEQKLLVKRMKMHDKIGNSHDYLGNGLTKDLNPNSPNEFGAVETLNFERKTIDLKELHEAGAITVIKDLQPL